MVNIRTRMDPSENHCMLCDRPNNVDNLVQCDQSDGYLHYSCIEVNCCRCRSYTCKRCFESDEVVTLSSHNSRRTSNSSRSVARTALRLQQLEKKRRSASDSLRTQRSFSDSVARLNKGNSLPSSNNNSKKRAKMVAPIRAE